MEVVELDPQAVWPLRQQVLRPHQRVEEVAFATDAVPGAAHFGVRDADGTLLGVATVAPEAHPRDPRDDDWRVRGMATEPARGRGRGAGALLLEACLRHAREHGGRRVWCNARTPARGFYERAGFAVEGDEFELPAIGPHVLMTQALSAAG